MDLEIVAGKNVTAYSELPNTNCVLLNEITMSEGGQFMLSNATLYGNGFVFDVTAGKYGRPDGYENTNYVVGLRSAKLDNIQIVGAVYHNYGITTKEDYNFPCVLVDSGNCTIANSYISNCASPVRVRGGSSVTFENTTLKGGSFCSLDIRGGSRVIINGLTTINQLDLNDEDVIGLGILVYYEGTNGSESITILNDSLTQYNMLAENQKDHAVSTAQFAYSNMFDDITNNLSRFIYDDGTTRWVNAGILSLTPSVSRDNITTPSGYDWQVVSMLGKSGNLCTSLASAPQSVEDYSSESQYAIAPAASFETPTGAGKKNYQAKTEGSGEYCYWDSTTSSILIGLEEGGSKSFDPNILTVTKNGKTVTPTVKLDDGEYQAVSEAIIFNAEGTYTLTYQYVDPYNYRYNDSGEVEAYNMTYVRSLKITVIVSQSNILPATFDFNGNGFRTIIANNTAYIMPDVSETAANSIGSRTIGGKTIYYPIVFTYYSTNIDEPSSEPLTQVSAETGELTKSNMWVWCPIFDGVITISDYSDENTPVVYNGSTLTLADGRLYYNENSLISALTWSSASTPNLEPIEKEGKLFFRSTNASNNARPQVTPVVEYIYSDAAGNTYHYFVGYFFPAKKKGNSCVAAGTMIKLADGTEKPIEEITAQDKLLTWDFNEGKTAERYVSGIAYHGEGEYEITALHFSDGTELKLIAEHGVFDYDLNRYVWPTAEDYTLYLGHRFPIVGKDGVTKLVTLDDVTFTVEQTGSYAISSDDTINVIAEGLVTVVPPVEMFNCFEMDGSRKMQYDREQMEQDIQTYGLYPYERFADYMTEEQYESFHYALFSIAVGKGILTWEDVVAMIELHKPYMLDTIWKEEP